MIKQTLLLLTLLALPLQISAEPIRLRADLYPPYNAEPNSEHEGYMVEIARRVFKEAGQVVDYQVMPWARSIKEAEAGTIDGIICAGKGDAPDFIFPDEPLGILRYRFFVPKDSTWNFSGTTSLEPVKLGTIADYSYGQTIDEYLAANATNRERIESVSGDDALEQNIQKLRRGRITALIGTAEVFYLTLDALKIPRDEFREAGAAPEHDPVYIAFSPSKDSSKAFAKTLSDGTAALRKSGELKKILERYDIKDWK